PVAMSSRTNSVATRQNRGEMVIERPPSRFSFRASRAPCRSPQLGGRHVLPAECKLARPMFLQMLEPPDGLRDAWPMADRHMPEDEIRFIEPFEPFVLARIKAGVHGLPDEFLQRLDALPYRHVDRHPRIAGVRAGVGRIAARVRVAPNEAGRTVGQRVDAREIVHEIRHARIVRLVANPSNVELGEM